MKPYSVRLPNDVCERLKKMGADSVRSKLIEIAGFTYSNNEKLLSIEELVRKILNENLDKLTNNTQIKETENTHEELTNLAIESILSIIE